MGALILAGLATIAVTIVHRMGPGKGGERAAPAIEGRAIEAMPAEGSLALPPGSHIAGMAVGDGRLVLRLEGPGSEQRLMLVELATGRRLGIILLETVP